MESIETDRLLLRPWRNEDLAPFAALNADPQVMEHFVSTYSRRESDETAARIRARLEQRGYGFWAVEVKGSEPFVGFVGLAHADFEAPFTPAVEIGWRLARASWGRGYATEAARAALRFAFAQLGLAEVVSFTVPANRRSRAVMERIGLKRDLGGDFDHPRVVEGHPIRRHVLYRLRREDWQSGQT